MAAFTLLGIALEPELELPYALLRQTVGDLLCPILLGPLDAIQLNIALSDPKGDGECQLIHVFESAVRMLGAHIASVSITDYTGGLFTTAINFENAYGMVAVEARPADALAMAVVAQAPILVSENVMAILAQAQLDALEDASEDGQRHAPSSAQVLRHLPDARPDMMGLVETDSVTDEQGRRHHVYSGAISGPISEDRDDALGEGQDGGGSAPQEPGDESRAGDPGRALDRLEPLSKRRM